jgi:uncharacterized membrane protein
MTSFKLPRKYDIWLLAAAAVLFFVALKVRQYAGYDLKGELSDFETTLWNSLHGSPLQMKCSKLSFLSEHFSPILFALVPLYAVFQTPLTLLAAQGVICALALVPLYHLTKEYTELRWPPLAVCLAFFFSRIVHKGLMYDFHMEIFYPFLFFCVFLASLKNKWMMYYPLLLLCASVKEDAFIAIAGLGLFLVFSPRKTDRKHGIITALFGITGLLCVLYYFMPYFRVEQAGSAYKFASYWGGYGNTQKEMFWGFLNPVRHYQVIFTPAKTAKMLNLFLNFAFLPLTYWRGALFLVFPCWFILFSSTIDSLSNVSIYYGLLITPFLFYATVLGINQICSKRQKYKNILFITLASLVLAIQFADSKVFTYCRPSYWQLSPRTETANELVRLIPADAAVSAQINLIAHTPPHSQRANFPDNTDNVEYIFLDRQGDMWPLPGEDYSVHVERLLRSGKWDVMQDKDDFLLLRKKPED